MSGSFLQRNAVRIAAVLLTMVAFSNVVSAQTRIVAFGTSYTQGYGVSSSQAWVSLLGDMLRAKGYNVAITNAGQFNDTARNGAARVGSAVPDGTALAIVEFGINEMKGNNGNAADVGPSLRAIADNLHSRHIKTIWLERGGVRMGGLGGPVVHPPLNKGAYGDERTKHLNPEGHAVTARALLPVVMSQLGRK